MDRWDLEMLGRSAASSHNGVVVDVVERRDEEVEVDELRYALPN